jgi:alkanesulfonate monooxygenase SsuD/methylene tetrahydromethanopterin reductase-like flavin-dependent oxidoreductase (luciferase family)
VIELYRQTLREHGFNPAEKEVSGVFQLYCGVSHEEARRNGGQYALQYFKFFSALDQRALHTSKAFEHYGGGVSRIFAGRTYEDLEQARLLMIGDPQYIIDQIQWAQEYYGVNYLIFEVAQGGEPHELVMQSLKRFGEKVMPVFK